MEYLLAVLLMAKNLRMDFFRWHDECPWFFRWHDEFGIDGRLTEKQVLPEDNRLYYANNRLKKRHCISWLYMSCGRRLHCTASILYIRIKCSCHIQLVSVNFQNDRVDTVAWKFHYQFVYSFY
ncbi:hypothetical protein C5167_020901 [Papaver somniferum]|uniref:Uncharacterized protein n=1 Tax=Papaver somniferum TaxID=3469 RepID=A0A4Y7IXE9_PAPSO|nr:hypothetical protein C5167_020901 [Papaver somniferum]